MACNVQTDAMHWGCYGNSVTILEPLEAYLAATTSTTFGLPPAPQFEEPFRVNMCQDVMTCAEKSGLTGLYPLPAPASGGPTHRRWEQAEGARSLAWKISLSTFQYTRVVSHCHTTVIADTFDFVVKQ